MLTLSFKDRVAIVTGAGHGLGRTYAIDIASRGGLVVVNDLGCNPGGFGASHDAADGVVAEIKAAGGHAVANYDTVATRQGAQQLVMTALKAFGRVDALINNAGNSRIAWLEDIQNEDLDAQLQVHLVGSLNVTHAVWPHLKAQKFGRVVFTSSAAGMLGNATQAAYGAAKAGIVGLMNVLSQEGEVHGILCNALMPNAISRLGETLDPEVMKENVSYVNAVLTAMPPSFTTALAVYLASEACTTSHSIYSSLGGRMARVFIGVTEGWRGSLTSPATAEEIAANIDRIRDTTHFDIPSSLIDEYRIVASRIY